MAQQLLELGKRAAARTQDPIMSEWPGYRPPPDAGARVVDEQLFRFLVDLEVRKAQRLRYCLSVVFLAVEGASAETREPALAEIVTRYIRSTDVVTPWAPGSLALLLVDAEASHLPAILRRLTARLETIAWSAGGSCYPKTVTRADDMLSQAIDSMVRAKKEGGNQLYVAS
jgi:hypothetical protein